ncbi:uncharacterized protein LOC127718193 [Mytilus californianus]|uniref:uncharacterized protein LOC127718193 n=1 Tax=Mytilus californianus TaxID=6549 RepID=UPI002246EDFD|nr:uncharacterized protein LOC127718193 [Mytilus californianus]
MASAIQLPCCGPCGYDDRITEARRWCTTCKEGLCENCENADIENKILSDHEVISIKDYRKIENVSISEVCDLHAETLEWFCKPHEKALCMVCVQSNHKSCSDVISIHFASKNARQSTAFSDLVESIDGTLSNLKMCIKNRESAAKGTEKQKIEIKNMVFETRTRIIAHLDMIEKKLLRELELTSCSCKSEYTKILQKLKSAEKKLTKLREQTLQFSSDIQVFLGTVQGKRLVINETNSIEKVVRASKNYEIKVDFDCLMKKLSKELQDFGQVQVTENSPQLDFRNSNINQDQVGITVPTSGEISDIQLQLVKSFKISMKDKNIKIDITSCVMLFNGHLLMANFAKKYLIEYSDDGKHVRDIQVSDKPCCIAVIDPCRIVVTYGTAQFLEIMNNFTFKVEKKISLQACATWLSQTNGKLYVVVGYKTIQVMDLSGRQLETIELSSNTTIDVAVSRDRIFYTDYETGNIRCCLITGEELWQFDSTNIRTPLSLAVDIYNNVYVVRCASHILTLIQHDGKDSKTLMTESNGLNVPHDVYIDIDSRKLITWNGNGDIYLYKIV